MDLALTVSPLYIGIHAILTTVLAVLVVRQRLNSMKDKSDETAAALKQAMRAHGNNIEYIPLALIVLVTLDLLKVSATYLHIMGGFLTLARLIHGRALSQSLGTSAGRVAGTLISWLTIVIGGVACIYLSLT